MPLEEDVILNALELQERRAAPAAVPTVIQTVAVPAGGVSSVQLGAEVDPQEDTGDMTEEEYFNYF